MNVNIEYNKNTKKQKIYLLSAISICLAFILFFILYRILFYKSPEEQLATINSSRAIPDSENAATIYLQLFEDYNESDFEPAYLNKRDESITRTTPWLSQDYPKISNWLEQNQNIIEKVMKLSQFEKCYFTLPDLSESKLSSQYLSIWGIADMDFLNAIKKSAFFLARSANNDIAEGRIENATDKYLCVLQMSDHFREQPITDYFLTGIAIGGIGSHNIRYLILNNSISEEQRQKIENTFQQIPLSFEEETKNINKVEKLIERICSSNLGLRERFIIWSSKIGTKNSLKEIFLKFSTDYRANLILIALKRYKFKTSKWPQTLDDIKPFLSSEDILIDPLNKGPLVYKLKDDSFILYSRGFNGIDENAQKKAPADDWPIWPLP